MRRSLLVAAPIAFTLVSGACAAESTFTRRCYDVPHEIVQTVADTVVLETGVKYIDTAIGSGAEAVECTEVTLQFSGELTDGTRFDEGGFTFVPGQAMVIPGFEQGVLLMREQGIRRIIVPPELGYGDRRRDGRDGVVIPPNSTLIFDVEVVRVVGD